MMQLFYAPEIEATGILPEDESGHCVRVLRHQEGDHIDVTDGKGNLFDVVIVAAHAKRCAVEIVGRKKRTEPLPKITIAVAPTKNMDRLEWFVEKATEIGVKRIIPLLTEHCERRVVKKERLEKTAIVAMKQSLHFDLPEIEPLTSWKDLLKQPFEGQRFIAHCRQDLNVLFRDAYQKGEEALVLIGPEGDFSEREIEEALALGYAPISLGNSRLRTETAALVAVHTVALLNE